MVDYSLDGTGVRESESFGNKVEKISFDYKEDSSSSGCAFNFYDENGNRVTTASTDNPQWALLNNGKNNFQFYEGDGYSQWVSVNITFNPSNGTATATYEDLSTGTTKSSTGSLKTSNYPVEVEFASAKNKNSWPYGGSDYTDTAIRYVNSQPVLDAPTNFTASASSNDVSLSWDSAQEANGYNILREPSSGGSYSQIASVGSGTTSFTDTGLKYSEDYAYKVESYN